jgi:hypothetical protein
MEQGYWALVISEDVSGENACLLAGKSVVLDGFFFGAVLIVGEKKQETPRLFLFCESSSPQVCATRHRDELQKGDQP